MRFRIAFLTLAWLLPGAGGLADTIGCDVCVYGGTSGGVMAAVQAARMGKKVVLVSDYGHLGGMSSSGLGQTDIGDSRILGGLSKEFYQRVKVYYSGGTLSTSTAVQLTFEPHVAEGIFDQMAAAAGVTVITGRIDLAAGVTMSGPRITALHMEDGTRVEAAMYIDACYEGDLMAQAGVTYTVGREPNSQYGETGNGIRGAGGLNQLPNGIDPYVVAGNPASGLLPGVNPNMGGAVGDGDHRLQAYCYRMCLTTNEPNRVMVAQPAGYREADYELLFRAIEAGQTTGFWKTSAMPNGKTDSNNASGMSCDLIGGNYSALPPGDTNYWDWTTLSHTGRMALAAKHRDWQLGLIWTVQNHPRVPQSVRDAWGPWGLCADEFTDNGHWPYNLYVREARRMVSDYVMTENNATNPVMVPDSIGMGAYTLDSHNTQRFVSSGAVKNEGDIQKTVAKPYPIAYRAIIPAAGECENLLVPWCTSSSHISFGSIRMEPVFMILGESAATAACLAMDDAVAVQQVDYDPLSLQLRADGQVLYTNYASTNATAIWLFASDDAATEGVTNDTAAFTVGRTGPTASALDVPLVVSGTASPGTDYPALTNTIRFAAGQAAISVKVAAPWDQTAEGDETIIVHAIAPTNCGSGSSTSATLTIHDTPPAYGASLNGATVAKVSGGTAFTVSVYAGKARYAGLASGVLGDGTVEAYRFFRNDVIPGGYGAYPAYTIALYASGGTVISNPTYSSVTSFANFDLADLWTTNDPDLAAANYGGTNATISGAREVAAAIDISGFATGTVYVLAGSYDDPFAVAVTMKGAGQLDLTNTTPVIDPVADRNIYLCAFNFENWSGTYHTITFLYTGSTQNRSRFMGVILDAQLRVLGDFERWSQGYLPSAIGGPTDDFDHDGLLNDYERIWGLDPTLSDSARPIVPPFDAGNGILTYTRRDPSLTGASFLYAWSTNLPAGVWAPFTPAAELVGGTGTVQTVSVTLDPALLAMPCLLLRVVAATN